MFTPTDYLTHSAAGDPGDHAELLRGVPADPLSLHRAVDRVLVHYRAGSDVTEEQMLDVDSRQVATILAIAADRAAGPLALGAETGVDQSTKVGGCCRDFTVLATAILRENGIPARSRVGFAGYFPSENPAFHHDHVVVERWDAEQARWARFDAELDPEGFAFDVADIPTGPDAPFLTASEAWMAWRRGELDAELYGVDPSLPHLGGAAMLQRYVILELAHLMKVETLLWDGWGPMAPVGDQDAVRETVTSLTPLTDRIADLIVRATPMKAQSEQAAAAELAELWHRDGEGAVAPGRFVQTWSPAGRSGRSDLATGRTEWQDARSPLETG